MLSTESPDRSFMNLDMLIKCARCSTWAGATPLQHFRIKSNKMGLVDDFAPRLSIHRESVFLIVPGN